ncbi:MAG: hypothetical protein U1F98_02335 [Verrucomicrobiota bacterium]
MSLNSSKSRISAVTRQLWSFWLQTREDWKDEKALEFERRFLQDLTVRVDKAVTVMDKLDTLLQKIKEDCE